MNKLVKHRIYKHFKGNYYYVEDIATNADNEVEYVIYRALYGDYGLWIRPLEEFLSEVDHQKYPDVKQKYRFELMEE